MVESTANYKLNQKIMTNKEIKCLLILAAVWVIINYLLPYLTGDRHTVGLILTAGGGIIGILKTVDAWA